MPNYNNDLDTYSSDEVDSWISQFCSAFGHDYFVEVAPEFIEDDFNLTGLSSIVPYYKQALDLILDLEPEEPIQPNDMPIVEHTAELLYGLIHSRFIITKQGLHAMAEKYQNNSFGSCPRYYCDGMHMMPIGRFDSPGIETIRLYCPSCNDIYLPSSSRYLNIDGAYFGTSFAGLFMKMFPEIKKQTKDRTKGQFQLKLFGFRLNESAPCGPRMKWLRAWPLNEGDANEYQKCEFEIPSLESLKADQTNDNNNMDNDNDNDSGINNNGNDNSNDSSAMKKDKRNKLKAKERNGKSNSKNSSSRSSSSNKNSIDNDTRMKDVGEDDDDASEANEDEEIEGGSATGKKSSSKGPGSGAIEVDDINSRRNGNNNSPSAGESMMSIV